LLPIAIRFSPYKEENEPEKGKNEGDDENNGNYVSQFIRPIAYDIGEVLRQEN